jgi:hypothetical protein
MSTKTTFKRIALVAVAALGLGVLSVAPSSAAGTGLTTGNSIIYAWTGDGLTAGDNGVYAFNSGRGLSTGNGVAGIANTVGMRVAADAGNQATDTTTAWADTTAGVAASGAGDRRAILTVTGGTFATTDVNTITFNTAGTQASIPANNGLANITVNTPTVGEVVVKVYRETAAGSGLYGTTAAETVTFTIGSAAINGVYAKATVRAKAGSETTAASITSATTDTFTTDAQAYLATASTTAKASFKVSQADALGVALATAATKAVTITTTIGSVGTASTTPVGSYTAVAAASANDQLLYLFSDGRSGKAVVTIAVNGVTAATYNVTFYSTTIASLTLTPFKPLIAASDGAQTGGGASATADLGDYAKSSWQFILVAKDANGNENTGTTPSVTVTSSNPVVATVALGSYSAVYGGWAVTGTAVSSSGTTTITVKDTATGLISATGTMTVASKQIASLVLATDAADYAPGDKVTVTLTAKDASGNPIADGVYYDLLDGAVVSTQGLLNYPWDKVAESAASAADGSDPGDVSFTNGVAKATFYAPQANFTLTATTTANPRLAYALQEVDMTVAVTVTNASTVAAQAATDAATEAIDAANAATDAANAAAEAADAATAAAQDAADAVAALSASVAEMMSALRKQITALTNIIVKIQKKVKA